MGLSVGIVGLPNVGKSTIFNALTAAGAQSANYPFCTIEPNVGIVPVVDQRLDKLAKIADSKQKSLMRETRGIRNDAARREASTVHPRFVSSAVAPKTGPATAKHALSTGPGHI